MAKDPKDAKAPETEEKGKTQPEAKPETQPETHSDPQPEEKPTDKPAATPDNETPEKPEEKADEKNDETEEKKSLLDKGIDAAKSLLGGDDKESKDDKEETPAEDTKPKWEDDLQHIKDLEALNDGTVTLGEVVAPTKAGEAAIHQMENIDMSKLISAPMTAAVQANFEASKKMLECIKEIGMKDDTLTVVNFTYTKNGRQNKMTVPLLTLVPISALTIKQMTYDFKVKITSDTSVNLVTGNERTVTYGAQPQAQAVKAGPTGDKAGAKGEGNAAAVKDNTHVDTTFGVSYSSKKNSTATQNSKYSVETNIDVNLTIGPDSMPGGISKMLEVLNDAIDVYNPNGELTVTANSVTLSKGGYASVKAVYYDTKGNCAPGKVTCTCDKDKNVKVSVRNQGDCAQVIFEKPGIYTIAAEKLEASVFVEEYVAATSTTSETTTSTEA